MPWAARFEPAIPSDGDFAFFKVKVEARIMKKPPMIAKMIDFLKHAQPGDYAALLFLLAVIVLTCALVAAVAMHPNG